jgi:D-alanine-D-alanine ligase
MNKELKAKRIGVLAGGLSVERDVSLRSGKNIFNALIRLGYQPVMLDPAHDNFLDNNIDIAFLALHGKFGEDGTIQSLLEKYNIPYTGSGVSASVIGMNKLLTKNILQKEGLPTPAFQVINESTISNPLTIPFPVIIKPIDEGSSVGVSIVNNLKDYQNRIRLLINKYNNCLVEKYISGKEITIGILEIDNNNIALPILQLNSKTSFYDFEAKYTKGLTEFILPAKLDENQTKLCQELAIKTHEAINCKGLSRVDMIFNPEEGPKILEINTIPGMTDLSDLPAQALHHGLSYDQLVDIILQSALKNNDSL